MIEKKELDTENLSEVSGGKIEATKNIFGIRMAWGAYSDIDNSFLGDFKKKSDAERAVKDYDESKKTDALAKKNREALGIKI